MNGLKSKSRRTLLRGAGTFLLGLLLLSAAWAAVRAQRERQLVTPPQSEVAAVFPGSARQVWERSRALTLYSISPDPSWPVEGSKRLVISSPRGEHDVLAQVIVDDPEKLADLRRAVDDIYAARPGVFAFRASCFSPRHAVRAQADGQTLDLVICFECGGGYLYRRGNSEPLSSFSVVSKRAEGVFNRLLRAGVPPPAS